MAVPCEHANTSVRPNVLRVMLPKIQVSKTLCCVTVERVPNVLKAYSPFIFSIKQSKKSLQLSTAEDTNTLLFIQQHNITFHKI